jgi:hypothetical protein
MKKERQRRGLCLTLPLSQTFPVGFLHFSIQATYSVQAGAEKCVYLPLLVILPKVKSEMEWPHSTFAGLSAARTGLL